MHLRHFGFLIFFCSLLVAESTEINAQQVSVSKVNSATKEDSTWNVAFRKSTSFAKGEYFGDVILPNIQNGEGSEPFGFSRQEGVANKLCFLVSGMSANRARVA